jgi:Small acidic protein family
VEQEEAKRIEIEVNLAERQRVMEVCAELGFTLDNVEGVADIKPKALGMKGQEVDFDIFEIGDRPSQLRIKDEKRAQELKDGKAKGNRVDLSKVADESKTKVLTSDGLTPAGLEGDFVSLDFGGAMDGQQFETLNYNHKLRRKLHRAIEAAQIQKELLVRAKAKEHCESKGIEVPPELAAEYKPIRLAGRRILEDGTLETEKQERVRKRLELAEYNKAAKVLRQQAKAEATEAGLRLFAELTGKKISDTNEVPPSQVEGDANPTSINENSMEQDNISTTQNCKKRQREDEDSDIKKFKKSKKSPMSVLVFGGEVNEVQEPAKEANKKACLSLTTSHISDAELAATSAPKESKPKDRKRKRNHNPEDQVDKLNQVVDEAARKEKKRLKKEQKQQKAKEQNLPGNTQQNEEAPEASAKKLKKSKRRKTESVGTSTTNGTESEMRPAKANKTGEVELKVKNGDQWNPDALSGNATRKDKFLRLLGGSKVNSNIAEKPSKKVNAKSTLAGLVQMENELERQFEAGIRMKHEGQRKKGLGA